MQRVLLIKMFGPSKKYPSRDTVPLNRQADKWAGKASDGNLNLKKQNILAKCQDLLQLKNN